MRLASLALLLSLVAAVAFGPHPRADAQSSLRLVHVGDFDSPVYADNAPGAKRLLFVVEQGGTIEVLRNGRDLARPFLDISELVQSGGEEGLLSVAFAPSYKRSRRFYVYFTNRDGDIEIDEFKRSRHNPARANRNSRRVVLVVNHPVFGNHNGGQLQFGPDGLLYIATGDGGGGGDGDDNARDTGSLLGKLLRIDPRPPNPNASAAGTRLPYRIPSGNPYVGRAGADEIYSYGLRNPWRFSFDGNTLTIGDVGQNAIEEIDAIGLGAARGGNFGWPQYEGTRVFDNGRPGADPPIFPVHEYGRAGGACAVTGGYVVRDPGLPSLRGRYIYADFCIDAIRGFGLGPDGASGDATIGVPLSSISSFGEGVRGQIYVVSLEGGVYRLEESGAAGTLYPRARSSVPLGSDPSRGVARAGDGRGGVSLNQVASFDQPTYVHGPPGAGELLYIVEREGVIKLVRGERKLPGSFLNIKRLVSCCEGERGLFSVAFAPDYERSRRFYVYFTNGGGDIEVDEFKRSEGSAMKADPGSRRKLLEIEHSEFTNHNGGQLAFGPDGLLYIGTGDGGGGGDPDENGQDKGTLLGKLLRIDPRPKGNRPYRIPRANPYVGRGGDDEIYSIGLRNPWRFSFDGKFIAIGDVGQDAFEEIDYVSVRKARGANFGWDVFEGNSRFEGGSIANHTGPIHTYGHGGGNCSITGGYVVKDDRISSLRGRYVYADLCAGEIRSLVPRPGDAKGDRALGVQGLPGITSFGVDDRNRLYATAGSGLYRFDPS
jgi:glucose/arabinose dehydrogenase